MTNLKEFAEQLVSLTVKEVNELAQMLKDEYGIEPRAAAVACCEGERAFCDVFGVDLRDNKPKYPNPKYLHNVRKLPEKKSRLLV